jgi:hypothetical protein
MNKKLNVEPNKMPTTNPKAPSLHEEPIQGLSSEKEVCKVCGNTFKTHTQLDRHMENEHGNPEKTHIQNHILCMISI